MNTNIDDLLGEIAKEEVEIGKDDYGKKSKKSLKKNPTSAMNRISIESNSSVKIETPENPAKRESMKSRILKNMAETQIKQEGNDSDSSLNLDDKDFLTIAKSPPASKPPKGSDSPSLSNISLDSISPCANKFRNAFAKDLKIEKTLKSTKRRRDLLGKTKAEFNIKEEVKAVVPKQESSLKFQPFDQLIGNKSSSIKKFKEEYTPQDDGERGYEWDYQIDLWNQEIFGNKAFRPKQREIINATKSGHDVIALIPTGGGKSLTFQISAMTEEGWSIIIMPLLSLIEDQISQMEEIGVASIFIKTGNDMNKVLKGVKVRLRDNF